LKSKASDCYCTRIFLFFLLLISGNSTLFAQPVQYRFNSIGLNQGVSSNRITAITDDHQGFLWFGTASGLNRYDGYSFKVFLNKEGDSTSINDNFIDKVVNGPLNSLWAYTPKGWNKYDPKTEQFVSRPKTFLSSIGVPHEWFKTIVTDPKGNYWFVFAGEGLFRYDTLSKKTDTLNKWGGAFPLYSSNISSVAFDKEGNIWMVYSEGVLEKRNYADYRLLSRNKSLNHTSSAEVQYQLFVDNDNDVWLYVPGKNQGVWWYQPKTDQLIAIKSNSGKLSLNNDIVNGIVQDESGNIWIATDHGGVNLIDKKSATVQYLYGSNSKILETAINSIFKDDQGTIWIGTFKTGIHYFNVDKSAFLLFQHNDTDLKSLPYNDVNCFAEDKKGNLWIGTNGGGLLYFNRETNTYKQYLANSADKNSLSNNVVTSLFVDQENKLWIGTYFGGLNYFDGHNFVRYKHVDNDLYSISDDSIWEIYEDTQGRLWIGTLTNGLELFNRKENKFYSFRMPHTFPYSTNSIAEDKNGNIWAGGTAGVEVYNKEGKLIRHITHIENDAHSLSNSTVLDIVEDKNGSIWMGTRDGLNLYNPQSDQFTRYRREDGLPHNTILRVLKDHLDNLWLSTPNGLSNVNINRQDLKMTVQFRNYDETDGLQGRAFNDDAAFITRAGELVFGGSNGFNIFMPPAAAEKKFYPPLTFTDLQLFNNSVRVGQKYDDRIILPQSITTTEKLVLKHDQNAFAVEFAALQHVDARKITYLYRLQGFNDTWISTDGNNRKVSFTGLNPGIYTLSVRAKNENGDWLPQTANLEIRILPPVWATTWAFCLYGLLIISGLLYGRYRIIRRTQRKFIKEQQELEERRKHELDAMKVHFFTNVSHEFKTPLALILTPVENLLKQPFPETEHRQFNLIHRNARRLLNMVDELLDFRKLELGELKLNKKNACIFRFCKDVYDSFSDIAERKNINFSFHAEEQELIMSFDPDKLERVLFNLLANAFKFTPEGGDVSLHIKTLHPKNTIEIRVSDTGIGIPSDRLEKIFERFFQNELPGSMINQGSGIGLSISKEFVRLHNGSIRAESELNHGSDFIVELPILLYEEEKWQPVSSAGTTEVKELKQTTGIKETEQLKKRQQPRKTILLVEDNEDYRFYIKDNLKEHFIVIEASNGKEGWQKALSEHPDLIVSDLNMPEFSGMELCRKVKEDKRTSFIPFILLTVVSSEISQLKGLDMGANDYITKPFNIELLISKIRNLLTQQDKFKETYQKQVSVVATEPVSASTDADFVQKALAFVEKNISNPELSVQELGREMLLGRATLYRKLFTLTGQTPVEFIRSIRLQRAVQLLEARQLTVSEIAYEVGFNDPKYFTKVFREVYNLTPSAYQDSHKKEKDNS
jgi:signal transduction histidine kinase/ligand-binding sensor domain-containing protein/DNA-binding response OmpR family regulator